MPSTMRSRLKMPAITEADIERLAAEADAGYDVAALTARRGKRGRPPIGSSAATVESVRLDPELRAELVALSASSGTTTSELMRTALRRYLDSNRSKTQSPVGENRWRVISRNHQGRGGLASSFRSRNDARRAHDGMHQQLPKDSRGTGR